MGRWGKGLLLRFPATMWGRPSSSTHTPLRLGSRSRELDQDEGATAAAWGPLARIMTPAVALPLPSPRGQPPSTVPERNSLPPDPPSPPFSLSLSHPGLADLQRLQCQLRASPPPWLAAPRLCSNSSSGATASLSAPSPSARPRLSPGALLPPTHTHTQTTAFPANPFSRARCASPSGAGGRWCLCAHMGVRAMGSPHDSSPCLSLPGATIVGSPPHCLARCPAPFHARSLAACKSCQPIMRFP